MIKPAESGSPRAGRGLSTLGCPDLSLEAALAIARRHRIGAIELRTLGGERDLVAWLEARYRRPDMLAESLMAEPVRVLALDTSFKLGDSTAEDRRGLLEFVPWAEAVGARWLRVFDGCPTAAADDIGRAAATWHWWRESRARHGWRVDLMVETHDALVTSDALLAFREQAAEAAILWDSHHTWKKGGEDPVRTWRAIRDAVVHVHVKDSVSRPSARHPFTYVLPGDGEFRPGPMLRAMEEDGFAGVISLEWERQWHPYLPPLETALAVADERGWW